MPLITSTMNDTKTSDQKKDKWNEGMTKPDKDSPLKLKPTILNPGTKIVTKKKTMTLITHLKAPSVNKLTGVINKFKRGFISRLNKVRQRAAQNKITKLSAKFIADVSFEIRSKLKKFKKIFRSKVFIDSAYHYCFFSCKNFF